MDNGRATAYADRRLTRRALLGGATTGAGLIFLAACGAAATPTAPAPTATTVVKATAPVASIIPAGGAPAGVPPVPAA
ncbi:MAG TPA: hypothetical protein VGC92_11510, partial [Phenylobacterium sp.]